MMPACQRHVGFTASRAPVRSVDFASTFLDLSAITPGRGARDFTAATDICRCHASCGSFAMSKSLIVRSASLTIADVAIVSRDIILAATGLTLAGVEMALITREGISGDLTMASPSIFNILFAFERLTDETAAAAMTGFISWWLGADSGAQLADSRYRGVASSDCHYVMRLTPT